MPSVNSPDSGRTSGKSNPRRAAGQGQNYAQARQRQMGAQQNMQGALGNARPPAGPPMGMQSIGPPPGGPMGAPPMGMGAPNSMQQMAVMRAGGAFDKPGMQGPPPMPQFQRPDMSQFQRGSIGQPPGPIGPPPGAIPPITGGPMPAPPGGGGSFGPPGGGYRGFAGQMPQRPMMPNPGMGSIGPPPAMGGGGPVASGSMGMDPQRQRMMQLAGSMRPGMM